MKKDVVSSDLVIVKCNSFWGTSASDINLCEFLDNAGTERELHEETGWAKGCEC